MDRDSVASRPSWAVFLLIVACVASQASAKDVAVRVDAHQMPWDPLVNPGMPFGVGDGRMPRYIFGFDLVPGNLIRIYASGAVTVLHGDAPPPQVNGFRTADQPGSQEPTSLGPPARPSAGSGFEAQQSAPPLFPPSSPSIDPNAPRAVSGTWGPSGQSDQISDGRTGVHGARFPSFYIGTRHYPVHVNELLGAFVDSDGSVVGLPFPVGKGVTLRVPEGAVAVSLGLNSESFAINRGSYTAVMTSRVPKVTVDPAADSP